MRTCGARVVITVGVALMTAVLVAVPAGAEDEGALIVMASKPVCRLRDPGKEGSVAQREVSTNKQIVEAISGEKLSDPNVHVDFSGPNPAIYIGKTFLVHVYPGDAQPNGVTPKQLAQTWAQQFRTLFPLVEPFKGTTGTTPAPLPPPKKLEVEVSPEDAVLLADLGALFEKARPLTAEEFTAQRDALVSEAAALIWKHTRQDGDPEEQPVVERANYSVFNGFRYTRELPPDYFAAERDYVAFTTVKRVRQAWGAAATPTATAEAGTEQPPAPQAGGQPACP